MKNLERTARYWSEQESWQTGQGLHWTEIPAVQKRLNALVSGDVNTDWIVYTVEHFLAEQLPVDHCLSLGCGKGELERKLASLEVFKTCDAFDVAPGSIDEARRLAADQGYRHIHYSVADVNNIELPEQTYDIVWVNMAMHHFDRLERVCDQIHQSLKPHGLLILNEYVGPSRFQFPARQRELMQAVFTLLPERYRQLAPIRVKETINRDPLHRGLGWTVQRFWDKFQDGDLMENLRRRWRVRQAIRFNESAVLDKLSLPTERDVVAADPSESVRSEEILGMLPQFFDVLEHKETGGTLLQFLLDGIAINFHSNDPQAEQLLDILFQIEDTLLKSGDIRSDFVYLALKAK